MSTRNWHRAVVDVVESRWHLRSRSVSLVHDIFARLRADFAIRNIKPKPVRLAVIGFTRTAERQQVGGPRPTDPSVRVECLHQVIVLGLLGVINRILHN